MLLLAHLLFQRTPPMELLDVSEEVLRDIEKSLPDPESDEAIITLEWTVEISGGHVLLDVALELQNMLVARYRQSGVVQDLDRAIDISAKTV